MTARILSEWRSNSMRIIVRLFSQQVCRCMSSNCSGCSGSVSWTKVLYSTYHWWKLYLCSCRVLRLVSLYHLLRIKSAKDDYYCWVPCRSVVCLSSFCVPSVRRGTCLFISSFLSLWSLHFLVPNLIFTYSFLWKPFQDNFNDLDSFFLLGFSLPPE